MAGLPAGATHSWGGNHWARTTPTFALKLGDNVNGQWDAALAQASADWSASEALDTTIVAGGSNKSCRATAGRDEVCNSKYGDNGGSGWPPSWAGGDKHITQATVKLNDTYFASPVYNTPAWRRFVTCQEIGHTFGLGHQDEAFDNDNLGSCMDYTNDASTNQAPNVHDFAQLETIYDSHLDGGTTIAEVTLYEDAVVTAKQAVPKERVRLGKDVHLDEETVSENLRKERIEVEGDVRRRRAVGRGGVRLGASPAFAVDGQEDR